ncbi:MAG: sugar phosphate nucleotidyltransferase [Acidobacteriota bacterium]|nr:sugar phosphate nucleotidyltransferase [Acidobacteriota bacterium]
MRAVVMAGGEGTRLRPLTSNQPKPMVSLCGKPCMEYIVELLKRHGIDETLVTLMFLPKAIRDYFGDGSTLGVSMRYSVEQTPAGTAGSVKLAEDELREGTFVVISGDALTDFDLRDMVRAHERNGAMVTIALKRVENPLEFGVVVVNEEGRIQRFLEKPTWGQVFSDTVNTGIYLLEPEVLDHIPADTKYDFSQELFPKLLKMGAPLYGHVAEGYWQDIGSLSQYLAANRDLLDGKVDAELPGIALKNRIHLGDGVDLDSLDNIVGPAFVGNYVKIHPTASIGAYSVLGSNVVVKEHAETRNSVVAANTYIGASAKVYGAVIGRNCDLKAGARFSEGSAVGDETVVGEQAFIGPDVRIYPAKTVESGAQVHSSIIWESRGAAQLFGKDGIVGLINVDITAELALNLAMAYGTALKKGARVCTSRDAHPASRVIKRALISGLNSTGVVVRDLRVASSAVNRFEVKSGNAQGGIHVRIASWDPEMIQIQVFEPPGINLSESRQKDVEKFYGRQDFRRAFYSEFGEIQFPDRAMETYVRGLLGSWDLERIRSRAYRLVIDYSHSPASLTLPYVLGDLGAEVLSLRAFNEQRHVSLGAEELDANLEEVRRLVRTVEADLGFVVGPGSERLYLVDDAGGEVAFEKALLLYVKLVAQEAARGEKIALPLTVTRLAERLAEPFGVEVIRTKVSLPALAQASTEPGVVFAGALGGGYIFPRFLPAFDAVMSLGKLLELLAPQARPLSAQLVEIPTSTLVHRTTACPWALKGTVMRTATEHLQHEAATGDAEIGLLDGVQLQRADGGRVQLLPDADEPVFHVYAEGADHGESERLAEGFLEVVRDVIRRHAG